MILICDMMSDMIGGMISDMINDMRSVMISDGVLRFFVFVFALCPLRGRLLGQLWTDIADKDISCFTSDIKEAINEEVRVLPL